MKPYQIDVKLKEELWKEIFVENYQIQLAQSFVENADVKGHGFKNHVTAFIEKLKQNAHPAVKQQYAKRQIYVVSYGMNTGSEINGNRPSIIYKDSNNTLGDDLIVIPLTSAVQQKLTDKFDISVPKDDVNKLFQDSYARLRQIRSVSIKRLGKCLGTIMNESVRKEINQQIEIMLATDK